MKIAIHDENTGFHPQWIKYCQQNGIPYKLVNVYDSEIIQHLEDCDVLMWHHKHYDYKDVLFAKQLLFSLEQAGKKVFPDFNTTWHFDDKVGQKYLLEAIHAPLVPSYVFYSKKEALSWIEQTQFPKVFKLRGGAGATNVFLVKNKQRAKQIVKEAFGKGIKTFQWRKSMMELWRKFSEKQIPFSEFVKYFVADTFFKRNYQKLQPRAFGYAYFQDFIPNNEFDIRVVVIGDKALGEKRLCRKGDFRASGSGVFEYTEIRKDVLSIAFEVAKILRLQSVAFDFIFKDDKPMIVEMSYAFGTKGLSHCTGYYTSDLQWHEEKNPDYCGWMVESVLHELK